MRESSLPSIRAAAAGFSRRSRVRSRRVDDGDRSSSARPLEARAPGARAPSSGRSPAGTCRSSTRARSPSTARSVSASGLFDLTHLGKVEVDGPGRARACSRGSSRTTCRRSRSARRSTTSSSTTAVGVIEDLIVYRLGEERYFVVPNASNTSRVLQILAEAETPSGRAPDVPPGLVLPRRAGPAGRPSS